MNVALHFQAPALRAWLVAAVLAGTAGCGLKGPLYMPDSKPDMVEVKVPPGIPTPTSQKKERESQGKQSGSTNSAPSTPAPPER
jgi:predicted small lipoprotein YifL